MTTTTNYALGLYAATDVADLTSNYNAAMNVIDAQMKTNADSASAAMNAANTAQTTAESNAFDSSKYTVTVLANGTGTIKAAS